MIVLPIPVESKTQRLHDEPSFTPRPDVISMDRRYGNRVAIWNMELRAGTVIELKEHAIVRVEPHAPVIHRASMDEYARFPKKIAETYLVPTPSADQTDDRIRALADRARGRETDPVRITKNIHALLMRSLVYGDAIDGLYTAQDAMDRAKVDCGGFSTLFIALAKACGIPARLVSGCWTRPREAKMHAWAEWFHPVGLWIPVDTSIEWLAKRGRTKRSGRYGFVGSDRLTLSYGDDLPITHNGVSVHANILQHPAVFVGGEAGSQSGVTAEARFIFPKVWPA